MCRQVPTAVETGVSWRVAAGCCREQGLRNGSNQYQAAYGWPNCPLDQLQPENSEASTTSKLLALCTGRSNITSKANLDA